MGLSIVGPELLRIIVNEAFHTAAIFVPLLVLVPFSRGAYFMLGTGFELNDDMRLLPIFSLIGILTLAGCCYLTLQLSSIGLYGVILAMISANMAMAFSMRYFAMKRFYVPLDIITLGKLTILVFSVSLLSIWLQTSIPFPHRIVFEGLILVVAFAMLIILLRKYKASFYSYTQKIPVLNKCLGYFQSIKNLLFN